MNYKINHANIKEWAKNYDGELFDGILCDPPYELGFMGKSWDSSGIAFDTEMWADIYKLLKPGAHLLAFSGSRTYHRMAVAIEDAGFEIRDMIEWLYGSGFPKSLNISDAIAKREGAKREGAGSTGNTFPLGQEYREYTQTENSQTYKGYGTALKPAHEPCVLARKPLDGTVANNVLKHGTGGLNIDGCRVESIPDKSAWTANRKTAKTFHGQLRDNEMTERAYIEGQGRFPANLIHDGSDEVEGVFPQTGKGNGGKPFSYSGREYDNKDSSMFNGDKPQAPSNFNDSGSASRFFYTAKASKSERNAGLDDMPLIHPGEVTGRKPGSAGAKNGGYAGMTETPRQNVHPTVKPLSLTKYLATLIKPPTGGRLLVPFSGSGSEMIGALQAGWEYVEGVELTEEYIPIAKARIEYWTNKETKQMELV